MPKPLVSLLLCTVRPSHAYLNHPEWDCIGKVITDLAAQVDAPPFELVIVDGFPGQRHILDLSAADPTRKERWWLVTPTGGFNIRRVRPRAGSPWVRMKKVAICAYRNTGIAAARGELIINLDDCCVLPPNFVSTFWRAWSEYRVALAMTWPLSGDKRQPGPVLMPGCVYGFSSYPRELALKLNGYDEAFDGGQALEDVDWGVRLHRAGLRQALINLPGFAIEPQTGHSPEAIDPVRPIVKCCNAAWQEVQVRTPTLIANRPERWDRESLRRLVGPCIHLGPHGDLHWNGGMPIADFSGKMCRHHDFAAPCAYLDKGFATALDPEAAVIFDEPPVVDLRKLAEAYR